jgi:putative transposase
VRYNTPGEAHELTFSCFRGLPLLDNSLTREWLVDALARARLIQGFQLWGYVIMPDHVHALLLPSAPHCNIAKILASIKQPVARRAMNFLREHKAPLLKQLEVVWPDGRIEHRFWQQGGGYDRNILSHKTAWFSIEYMHFNPVRRGLTRTTTEWIWSSARWYAGLGDAVLSMDMPPERPAFLD